MAKTTKSKKNPVKTVDLDKAVITGKSVDVSDVVSLVGPDATAGGEPSNIEFAHAPVSSATAKLESRWVKPNEVLVEFDDRVVKGHDQETIDRNLAISIFIHGQKQPAVVFEDAIDGKLQIVSGRTRRRAVQLLNIGFEAIDPRTNEPKLFKDEDRPLWVVVDNAKGKEDAFVEALQTNIQVSKLDDVQEAYAVKKLTEEFNWSLTEAAKLFGYNNTNRASRLVKLLTLEQEVIERVQAGKLALQVATDLAPLKAEHRLKLIEQASDESGKVDGANVRDRLRDLYSVGNAEAGQVLEDTGATKPAGVVESGDTESDKKPAGKDKTPAGKGEPEKKIGRNAAALKKFIETEIESNADVSESAKKLFATLKGYFEGTKGEKALWYAIENYVK